MALNDISLTSGMRSNLLSLQGTVDLLNRTQNRLSTGKKVNTAIDNPVSYFASQALTARASTIDSLKDSMGQAVQTITAADKGITAITAMIEQAKGLAQSAQSADNTGYSATSGVSMTLNDVKEATSARVNLDVSSMTITSYGKVSITLPNMVVISKADIEKVVADNSSIQFGVNAALRGGITGLDFTDSVSFASAINGQTGTTYQATEELDADGVKTGNVVVSMQQGTNVQVSNITGTAIDNGDIKPETTTVIEGLTFAVGSVTLTASGTAKAEDGTFNNAQSLVNAINVKGGGTITAKLETDGTITVGQSGATLTSVDVTNAASSGIDDDIDATNGSTIKLGANTLTAGWGAEGQFVDAKTLVDAINDTTTLVNADGAKYKAQLENNGTVTIFTTEIDTTTGKAYNVTKADDVTLNAGLTVGTDVGEVGKVDYTDIGSTVADTVTLGDVTLTAGADKNGFSVSGDDAADANALAAAIMSDIRLTSAGYSATADGGKVTIRYSPNNTPTNITTADTNIVDKKSDGITMGNVAAHGTALSALQDQYNETLNQITALAKDSGYKGKNLLSSDTDLNTMTVQFEGNTLTVKGFDASATKDGLGVNSVKWATGNISDISASLEELDNALSTLTQKSSEMSGNLSIITVRQNFSTNMINTLTQGSDNLTLADANEEGANMLMLQTRQSLSTTALSLSAQAAQSVLKLFG